MQLQTQRAWLSQQDTGTSIAEESHLSFRAGLGLLLPHTALVPPPCISPLLSSPGNAVEHEERAMVSLSTPNGEPLFKSPPRAYGFFIKAPSLQAGETEAERGSRVVQPVTHSLYVAKDSYEHRLTHTKNLCM